MHMKAIIVCVREYVYMCVERREYAARMWFNTASCSFILHVYVEKASTHFASEHSSHDE